MKYCLTEDGLGWRNLDGVILRCVNEEEAKKMLEELHYGYCGGHFAARTTSHKILRASIIGQHFFLILTSMSDLASLASTSLVNQNSQHNP
jgi:hypothetical protein